MKFFNAAAALLLVGFASNTLAMPVARSDLAVAQTDVVISQPELAVRELDLIDRDDEVAEPELELEERELLDVLELAERAPPIGKATDEVFGKLLDAAKGTRVGKTGKPGVGAAGLASDGSIITGHSQGGGVHAEDDVLAKASAAGKTITHILPFGNNGRQPTLEDKVVPPCKAQCEGTLENNGIVSLGRTEASKFNKANGLPTTLTKKPKAAKPAV